MQAWMTVRDGELAEQSGDALQAYTHYQKALRLYDSVALYYPKWKPQLVKDRIDLTKRSMAKVKDEAEAAHRAEQKKTADLVAPAGFPEGPAALDPGPELNAAERQQVAALQQRIGALEQKLANAENDRDANANRLREALDRLRQDRDELARAPLQLEITGLNKRIEDLAQERDAMADALRTSRREQHQTQSEAARLRTDMALAREQADEFKRNLEAQAKVNDAVVTGLHNQLEEAHGRINELTKQLADADQRSDSLERELLEARAEIDDLKAERDQLLKERDQMAALLKMNESDRVKALIEENMSLGRDLSKARERLQALFEDNNATKDELTEAKRDIAVAKVRIIQLKKENDEKTSRLTALESRLKEVDSALESGVAGTPDWEKSDQEVQMLRSIVKRQLKVQSRRHQAKKLLVEQVSRLGIEDREFLAAVSILEGQEIELSEEENQLLEGHKVDDEFVFNDYVPEGQRVRSEGILQERIKVRSEVARRAFANGRFLASREVFESVLLEHPGHVPTKLNLGVVHLRLKDPMMAVSEFTEALAMRPDLPYADFMLGVAQYQLGEFDTARSQIQKSLNSQPDNAKAHVFLGSIAGMKGQAPLAQTHFEEAIGIDPTLSDPYYNLAVLSVQRGAKDKALEYYRQAITNGADPDLAFERQLEQ